MATRANHKSLRRFIPRSCQLSECLWAKNSIHVSWTYIVVCLSSCARSTLPEICDLDPATLSWYPRRSENEWVLVKSITRAIKSTPRRLCTSRYRKFEEPRKRDPNLGWGDVFSCASFQHTRKCETCLLTCKEECKQCPSPVGLLM